MSLIYELIPKVMGDIGAVAKTRKNEQQKYSFRGIEDFYQEAHPAFVRHGIFCVPEVIDHAATTFERTNDYGKMTVWRHVTIKVKHQFFASDGSHVDVTTMGEGLDNSDKATNKAMSGAMKYALIELFSVPTQDVEDSDRTSPEMGLPTKVKPVQRTTEPIPLAKPQTAAKPNGVEYIDSKDAQKLHIRFANALNEDIKAKADEFLYAFLKLKGFIDADGVPSASMIPKDAFKTIGPAAIAHAQELNNAKSEENS